MRRRFRRSGRLRRRRSFGRRRRVMRRRMGNYAARRIGRRA